MQETAQCHRLQILLLLSILCLLSWLPAAAQAQEPREAADSSNQIAAPTSDELTAALAKVDIKPQARDEEIAERLQSVLKVTDWFTEPQVEVNEGVVFLSGQAYSEELKKWAGDLARNTQDVVAVANRIEVITPSIWDFSPAKSGFSTLWRDVIRALPLVGMAVIVVALSLGAGILATRAVRRLLRRRIRASLLLNVIARTFGALVFLFGVYVVLRIAGLTQLAFSIVGGTGLIGLAVGIAFRDITENFLASIFLSMQRPFQTGDLVEVSGVTGYVQQLNVRSTIVMTLDGIVVQIPNAAVYKNNLHNFTTNSNRREDFVVGIGYDDSIGAAQEIARNVLAEHPAVLDDPEPSVLADSMGRATINLRIYFWLNGREHSWLKVRSSVIRLIKVAFQEHGISMPDEAREVVFPDGVPVTVLEGKSGEKRAAKRKRGTPAQHPRDAGAASTKAEAGLYSEAGVIKDQARQVRPLREKENLLRSSSGTPSLEQSGEKQSREAPPNENS